MVQWRSDTGDPAWEVIIDEETFKARTVFNGRAGTVSPPANNGEWFARARSYVAQAEGLLGVEADSLQDARVLMLPLGMTGGTDKVSVRFSQAISAVPVFHGFVSAVFDMDGRLLCLDSDALPGLTPAFDVEYDMQPHAAETLALEVFFYAEGVQGTSVGNPLLVIAQTLQDGTRQPRLAWQVDIDAEETATRYFIDAQSSPGGGPALVETEPLVFEIGQQTSPNYITGTVTGKVTEGAPDWRQDLDGTNLTQELLSHMYIRKASNNALLATTNESGAFSFAGGFLPIDVKLRFQGPYVDVCSLTGTSWFDPPCSNLGPAVHFALDATVVSGASNALLMNPNYGELVVAQANVFFRVNELRDWIRDINPLDGTFDAGAPYRVRPNKQPPGCISRYSESNRLVVLARMGTPPFGCVSNTAIAQILWHEMGHWMNVLYGHGNSVYGFGEGIADVWSMYQTDHPLVGPVNSLRDGNNTLCFCGGCPPVAGNTDCQFGAQGCHPGGGGHVDGQPLMGALWKIRTNLKAQHGVEVGGAMADALFLGWMNAFTIGRVQNVIAYQWAVLDSADGHLAQSPNLYQINAGFQANVWPGILLPPVRQLCP